MKKSAAQHGRLLRKKLEQPTYLKQMLYSSELNFQALQEEYERVCSELSATKKALRDRDTEIRKLKAENRIVRFLKNDAYRFLFSEGYGFNYKVNLWQRKPRK